MDQTLELLTAWFEQFDLYFSTQSTITVENKVLFFLTLASKEAFLFVLTLAHPTKPAEKPYADLRKLLIDHVKPQDSEMTE